MILQHKWSYPYALQVSIEYKRFMAIRAEHPDTSPSDVIDMFWHQHILNTRHYRDWCGKNFTKFIDHDPTDTYNQKTRKLRLQKTLMIYSNRYKFSKLSREIWDVGKIQHNTQNNTQHNTQNEKIGKINILPISVMYVNVLESKHPIYLRGTHAKIENKHLNGVHQFNKTGDVSRIVKYFDNKCLLGYHINIPKYSLKTLNRLMGSGKYKKETLFYDHNVKLSELPNNWYITLEPDRTSRRGC